MSSTYTNSNGLPSDVSMSSGCSYTSLGNYTKTARGVAMPQASFALKQMIVPTYGASASYASLTHGSQQPNCSGYFNIGPAYNATGGSCMSYANYGNGNCK